MDNLQTYHRPAPSPARPLEPGPYWDNATDVEWNVLPRSPFADAVRYLKLPYRSTRDGNLIVKTTAADLLLVIAYCHRQRETTTRSGLVVSHSPKTRAPWWDEKDDDRAD